jgi:hypothetical protein
MKEQSFDPPAITRDAETFSGLMKQAGSLHKEIAAADRINIARAGARSLSGPREADVRRAHVDRRIGGQRNQ